MTAATRLERLLAEVRLIDTDRRIRRCRCGAWVLDRPCTTPFCDKTADDSRAA